MKRIFRRLILTAACLALSTLWIGATNAQSANASLYVALGTGSTGDIFAYSPVGLKNLTSYGYNARPVLSPDGKYIAYGSIAQVYLDEGGRSGAPSTNIWLMDTATGNAQRIADQPADNRATGDNRVRPFIARSDPVWSPDSSTIAWLEDSEGTQDAEEDDNDHLMLYSLASGKTTEIYKQPIYAAGCPCSSLTWTAEGISVIAATDPMGAYTLRILNPQGNIQSEIPFDDYPQIMWLNGEKASTLVTADAFITLKDNRRSSMLPPLEIYSLAEPDGVRFRSASGFFDADWSLVMPGAEPLEIGKIRDFAIAPDGVEAAYITSDNGGLYVFDGRKTIQVDLTGVKVRGQDTLQAQGLAWSALAVRVQTEP